MIEIGALVNEEDESGVAIWGNRTWESGRAIFGDQNENQIWSVGFGCGCIDSSNCGFSGVGAGAAWKVR
jgi:hypothetical protein